MSEDIKIWRGNERKYICGDNKNNRQRGYDDKKTFEKWGRKTNSKDFLGIYHVLNYFLNKYLKITVTNLLVKH